MKVGGGRFLSSHDPRMVLGIGKRTKIDWVEVKWPGPSELMERFTDLPIDKYVKLAVLTGWSFSVRLVRAGDLDAVIGELVVHLRNIRFWHVAGNAFGSGDRACREVRGRSGFGRGG
jgi:hypothetical protein